MYTQPQSVEENAQEKTNLKPSKRTLWQRILDNNEYWGIPLAGVLFFFSPLLFRGLDKSAGAYDVGLLQALFFGLVAFLFIKGCVWLLLRLDFPNVYKYLDNVLDELYTEGRPSHTASRMALILYALYLVLTVLLVAAVL